MGQRKQIVLLASLTDGGGGRDDETPCGLPTAMVAMWTFLTQPPL